MTLRGPAGVFSLLAMLGGCASFPSIELGECGNAVVEKGEACDTFARYAGASCRPKGTEGACQYDCRPDNNGERPACPPGMGCAANGICRWKGDGFAEPEPLSPDPASWLSSADFDGDGHADVLSSDLSDQLQQARFRLHYFDADNHLQEARTFPRVTTRPAVRDVDHDGRDDLLFSNLRIGMLRGRRDREWIPAPFSSYVLRSSGLRVLTASDTLVSGILSLVVFTTIAGVPGIYLPSLSQNELQLALPLPRPIEDLAGMPLAADLLTGEDSPCRDVAFAFRGEQSVSVVDLCRLGVGYATDFAWRDPPEVRQIQLAAGARVDAGLVAADVDGDHHLDLLVGATLGGSSLALVSHADGNAFGDASEPLALEITSPDAPAMTQTPALPLAAGDISGDDVADYVLPHVVYASYRSQVDGSIRYARTYANNGQPWTTAQVLDLNGNGLCDVIAAALGAPGLTFLNGTGAIGTVPAQIATRAAVRLIGTGDFDGDLIGDVGFVEAGAADAADSLAIAFGARDRVPLEPVRITELSSVQQLGRLRDGGTDDLFTASVSKDDHGDPLSTFTIFGGTADRLPFAPYTLVNFSRAGEIYDWNAIGLITGAFSAASSNDVVAIGARAPDAAWSQWLIPQVGQSSAPPQLLEADALDDVSPLEPGIDHYVLRSAGVAADVDDDGVDEALWLMPRTGGGCTLLIESIRAETSRVSLRSRVDFDEPCITPELSASKLHRPGPLHLLALLGDPARGPRRLSVLWNDGAGGFSKDDRSVLDVGDEDVRAFSVFPRDASLALVSDVGLRVVQLAAEGRELGAPSSIRDFTDAQAVVATDPNDDGLDDLVVSDADGIWFLGAALK